MKSICSLTIAKLELRFWWIVYIAEKRTFPLPFAVDKINVHISTLKWEKVGFLRQHVFVDVNGFCKDVFPHFVFSYLQILAAV